MKGLTAARLDVLTKCTKGEGLRPLDPDWYAIYWLREHGLIVRTFHRAEERYAPTAKGEQTLEAAVARSQQSVSPSQFTGAQPRDEVRRDPVP